MPQSSNQTQRQLLRQFGFSLVEMMIVMIIAGFFIAYGSNKLGNRSSQMKSAIRKFTVITKKLRNRARVDNKTYRLVFDLPLDKKKEQAFWIEGSDKTALLLSEEQLEELQEIVDNNSETTNDGKEKPKPDPQGFTTDTRVIKKPPATLPDGLYFESIELDGSPVQTLKEGRVYIYFFPQGYIQRSAIHITNKDNLNWTIAIEGITGKVDILPEFRSLEDIKDQ